ncbi:hypothetical protein CLAFUW4_13134, partial [Fulvia fulva]
RDEQSKNQDSLTSTRKQAVKHLPPTRTRTRPPSAFHFLVRPPAGSSNNVGTAESNATRQVHLILERLPDLGNKKQPSGKR